MNNTPVSPMDTLYPSYRPHHSGNVASIGRILVLGLLLLPAACTVEHRGPIKVGMSQPLQPSAQPKVIHTPQAYTPPTVVEMISLNMPRGQFNHNAAIWKLLSPLTISHTDRRMLRSNGLRTGAASFSRWKKLSKILNSIKGLISQRSYIQTAALQAVVVNAKMNVHHQFIAFRPLDGRLVLRTFHNCDDIFLLTAEINRQRNHTVLQIVPAVNLGTVIFNRGPYSLGVVRAAEPVRHIFRHLIFDIPLPPDHFMVVAPTGLRTHPNLIGPTFLSDGREVPARETVLVFAPLDKLK